MRKLTCIIVDDEPVARRIIAEFTRQLPWLLLCGEMENAVKAGLFVKENKPDLVFLDIEMPKLSGLDWLKSTPEKPLVILTTAYPNYALEGYDLDIIDYLLKPISFTRFLKAADKAREYAIMRNTTLDAAINTSLFVRTDKRIEKIQVDDILYIESVGNYVRIVEAKRSLLVYLTMKGIQEQLPVAKFTRIHQAFLVNFSMVSSVAGQEVKVQDKLLPLSRHYKDQFMRMIEERMLRR